MKNTLVYLCLFLNFSITVYSQTDVKARIEYEEAEKAFIGNDFNASFARLNETEKLLGKTNPKILYLKILSQNEIIKLNPYADFGMIVNIRKNADTYMKMIEDKKDLYDKYKEVYKIKQDLEIYSKSQADFEIKKNEDLILKKNESLKQNEVVLEKEAFIKDLFERVNFTFEPDKPLDYYISKYPDFNTFIKKAKKTESGDKTSYAFKIGIGRVFGNLFRVELSNITTKNNKVLYVSYTILSGNSKERGNIWNEFQKISGRAINNYGSQAVVLKKDSYNINTFSYFRINEKKINCRLQFFSYEENNTLGIAFFSDGYEID